MTTESSSLLGNEGGSTPAASSSTGGTGSSPTSPVSKVQAFVFDLVEGEIDSWFEYLMLFVIFLNVFLFIVGTIVVGGFAEDGSPPLNEADAITLDEKYDPFFEGVELFSVILFTIEYLLRAWSCTADPTYRAHGAFVGRLKYLTSFFCIIDLLAILPYWLNVLGLIPEVDFSTALRVFRLIRLLKADKYINAFALLDDVLAENSTLLIATLYYAALMLVLCSTALYLTERFNPDNAKYFQSIPDAMFVTTLMLTGEYPIADFTVVGRFVAAFIALVAVAFFAVPTGVLGSGFIKAVERAKGLEFSVDAE
uniref:Ion transport domain-containing protein n=1 Tax=Timspurckia oligopyrenoides TaxID=708627 RepID=A0A7S0ZLH9_9RHOD|mmetsp:Transcript_9908/g.17852  ORF Transcript_9908/g.17852 Transcript_9908/m.17852 type:complete len:310 (+) Transcript_9908:41-970(+)|eukprot:CAMPEP_0182443596 /NCGR_PEP_ID=MMETSP1172-20130603/2297_1 /TAXON_ID=708627 /ORGANISM="Timspurckia oligopyrenoides, Strain CCMP3278" /LENGTH=309 /DNA_ID=CAMNT_0024638935 /DNA_START=28 /DNA_END=957 /DNA_ORIENTATION=-